MKDNKDCHGVPSWYYVRDMYGVPDGKRMLASVRCSCCGQYMYQSESEVVDCGTRHVYECRRGHCNFVWYDLIEEC